MKYVVLLALFVFAFGSESYYEKGRLVTLEKLPTSRGDANQGVVFYKTSTGKKVGVNNNQILVKCKPNIDCKVVLARYGEKNLSRLTDEIYILQTPSVDDVFMVAKTIYETGYVEFAHPDFVREKRLR